MYNLAVSMTVRIEFILHHYHGHCMFDRWNIAWNVFWSVNPPSRHLKYTDWQSFSLDTQTIM
jgi:hypothetical protein